MYSVFLLFFIINWRIWDVVLSLFQPNKVRNEDRGKNSNIYIHIRIMNHNSNNHKNHNNNILLLNLIYRIPRPPPPPMRCNEIMRQNNQILPRWLDAECNKDQSLWLKNALESLKIYVLLIVHLAVVFIV